jgi:hypothetical protein
MRATSPALAMHKHTARLPACSAVVGIADGAEALDNRAPAAGLYRWRFFHLGGLRRPELVVLEGHAAGIEQLSGCDAVWGGPVSAAGPARLGAGTG